MVWFTVQLDDRPGALAAMAQALADHGININAIVGIAEDTDGALMLTTSDPVKTREVFGTLGLAFEEHDPEAGVQLDQMAARGLADRGMSVGG